MAEDVGLAAGDGVFIGNADDAERHAHAGLHQHGGTRFAQAAMDRVFFRGDDRAALAAGFEHGFASSGLTVCMLSTRQFSPCSASCPAASRA